MAADIGILGTIPGWIGAIGSGGAFGLLLKYGLEWRKQVFGEGVTLRSEDRLQLEECHATCKTHGERIALLELRFTAAQIKLNATLIAYRIVEVAYEALAPNSTAVQQARAALQTAYALAAESGELEAILGKMP